MMMYDFIPSKSVREFWEKNGAVLSEYERTVLEFRFCRKNPTLEDRVSGFRKIAAETNDEELRAEVNGMLADFDTMWNEFITNDGSYIYEVLGTIYFNYEDAFKDAIYSKYAGKSIKKKKLENGGESVFDAIFEDNGERKNFIDFTRKGDPLEFKKTVSVPEMPFKRGDLVMSLVDGEIGAVEFCGDSYVDVLVVGYDGELKRRRRNCFWLEKLDSFDREGKAEKLLRTARDCMLGKESLCEVLRLERDLNGHDYDKDFRVFAEGYEHDE
ncbi:MAG: hypothetical protein NC299_14700 [Lachnospiraceae bacterium]|nr:hypothetical protein [Ruminococcus sp.]MCM1276586.1 hypothetical protein [Lachnospiraceae bacterium]